MSLREKIENNLAVWFLGTLFAGFLAGIGAYKAVLEMAQLEIISRGKLEALRTAASGAREVQTLTGRVQEGLDEQPQSRSLERRPKNSAPQSQAQSSDPIGPVQAKPRDVLSSLEKDSFKFDFLGCAGEGIVVKCYFEVLNSGDDLNFCLQDETRLFDDKGREHHITLIQSDNLQGNDDLCQTFVSGVKRPAIFVFEGISQATERIAVLELYASSNVYAETLVGKLRDISLKR